MRPGRPALRASAFVNCSAKRVRDRDIGILRLRHDGEADPEILRLEPGILLTQPHETGDEQRRAGEQRDRKRDLRADQQFAETLLPHAAGRSRGRLPSAHRR